MIGRNDPCHCGSGKKYKRCCGSTGVDLVDMIVNEELERVLRGYFEAYPKGEAADEMKRLMREWLNRLDNWEKTHVEEASSEFYLFIQNADDWRTYLNGQIENISRQSVLAVLQEWAEPFMLLAEITDVEADVLHVQALFGDQKYRVTRNEGMPTDVGTLMFGVVLRDARKGDNAIAPVSSVLFLAKWSKQTKRSLYKLREVEADKPREQFIIDHVLDIYELFVKRSMASMNEVIEEVLMPGQLSALKGLDLALQEVGQAPSTREMMHKLAVAYFLNESEEVAQVNDFVAAAIQTAASVGVIQEETLDEATIRERFDASKEGMAFFAEALEALYADMMASGDGPIAARRYEIGTDPRPTEKALWETSMTTGGVVQPGQKPTVSESRAQLLAYEAYESNAEENRRSLAKRAAEMDAENPDVLLLQAEVERNHEKAVALYEKSIRNASRTFDAGENPWQNVPNRPFMRAAFAYGVYLFGRKEYDEAASVFMDLLKMNRTDNQGARYEAVASLIHAGRYQEAAKILIHYEKGSEHDAAYLYLDWKLEHDGSEGASENAGEMLQAAIKANRHVMHLKTFKAKPIPYPRFHKIEPGSEEEARYIWLLLSG